MSHPQEHAHPQANSASSNANNQPPSLGELIVKYGDSSNTTWVEDKFSIWRHLPTGAAIGYALSNGDSDRTFCIIWGSPLCEHAQISDVVNSFLAWLENEGHSPIWACVGGEVERVLAEDRGWHAVMCIQDDALDPTRANPEQNKEVRKHIRKAQRAGCTIVVEDSEPSDEIKREIDEVIKAWKASRRGTQVHTTNVEPWRDTEHRRYFYARDAEGKIVGFLFIAQVAGGWAIKDSIQVRSAPKNLTEWLISSAIHTLADKGEHFLTFGPTPAPTLETAGNARISSSSFKFLSKTYGSIEHAFLGNKREFRKKFEVEGEPIFVCYPPHGLGRHGISALMKMLTD
ncbi:hypothetical protein M0805_007091 [Coniferiporia weirii]|nr:hypothetical protein M0805_007091 [Coniferiporia weirii]